MVVAFGILLFFFFTNITYFKTQWDLIMKVLQPFFAGFAIAYLLSVPLNFFEKKLFRRTKISNKLKHLLCILLVYILAVLLGFLFVKFIGPPLFVSIKDLGVKITDPEMYRNISAWMTEFLENNPEIMEMVNNFNININDYIAKGTDIAGKLVGGFVVWLGSFTGFIYNLVIGLILSIYMVYGKDKFTRQIKKACYAIMPQQRASRLIEISKKSSKVFTQFLIGKIIDSTIIGFMCFGLMSIFKMDYAVLISTFVGITNIIPFFGPIIGAIPGFIILLTVNPMTAVWFAILILALQQFDGNILGPYILGDSTGLSAFWVMFAILIGGGLFGFWGMLLGVPAFAVIYALFKEYMENRLKKKNLPTHTEFYTENFVEELREQNEQDKKKAREL